MDVTEVQSTAQIGMELVKMVVSGLIAGIVASLIQLVVQFARERKNRLTGKSQQDPAALRREALQELLLALGAVDPCDMDSAAQRMTALFRMAAPYTAQLPGYPAAREELQSLNGGNRKKLRAFHDTLSNLITQAMQK